METATLLLAQAAPTGPSIATFIFPLAILAIFYFILIVPQRRQLKAHQELVQALQKGDQVVTAGGLLGKVIKVDEQYAEIEIAQGVRVKAVKSTIGDIVAPGGTPAND